MMKMKTMTRSLLLPFAVPILLYAPHVTGSRSKTSRCVELNFEAGALQGGDAACTFHNAIINGGSNVFNRYIDMTIIDATCGTHLEDVELTDCVQEVVDIVSEMDELNCEVTGGTTVANFIYTVYGNHEGFDRLVKLACQKRGECYSDIIKAIDYCKKTPDDANCMNYVTCDCLIDLLAVIEAFPDNEDYIRFEAWILDRIKGAGLTCRCEDLDARALSLELGEACALSSKILAERDILAGDITAISEACAIGNGRTCIEDAMDNVNGFMKYGCTMTQADAEFIYTLNDSSEDFMTITDFACNNNDCYSALRTCQNDVSCVESLSCDCLGDFLSIVDNLSPDTKDDFVKTNTSTINGMESTIHKCKCTELNERAALFQDESYCALPNSIVPRGKSMFAGYSSDFESTCPVRYSCAESVSDIVRQIYDAGCKIKQKTDYSAKFLYNLNMKSDWDEVIDFICSSYDNDDVGCYDEIQMVVEKCSKSDDISSDCTEAGSDGCLDTFTSMMDRLSEPSVFIDQQVFDRIEPAILQRKIAIENGILNTTEIVANDDTAATNNATTLPGTAPQSSAAVSNCLSTLVSSLLLIMLIKQ